MSTSPQSATKNEREQLLARLASSRERYLAVLRDVADEQAGFVPGEGRWSILQCAEHVLAAEKGMLRLYQKLAQPGTADRSLDHVVSSMPAERESRKMQAPEISHPKGRFNALKDAADAFSAARQETIAYLQGLDEDLRSKVVHHPIGATFDGFQLFLLMSSHIERHALQIEEIKSHPAYPRGK